MKLGTLYFTYKIDSLKNKKNYQKFPKKLFLLSKVYKTPTPPKRCIFQNNAARPLHNLVIQQLPQTEASSGPLQWGKVQDVIALHSDCIMTKDAVTCRNKAFPEKSII